MRKAFDVFFLRYPYCYGYWKKYADIEKKHGNIQVAEEVNMKSLSLLVNFLKKNFFAFLNNQKYKTFVCVHVFVLCRQHLVTD